MKKNMKKLYSLLFMAVLVLGLTACGTQKDAQTDSVVDSAVAESLSTFFVGSFTEMPAENMQYFVDMELEELQSILDSSQIPVEAEAFQNAFTAYLSSVKELGAYEATGEYELTAKGEETTHVTNLEFADHDAKMTLVFNAEGIVTSTSFDITYSMGEILQKAGLNTLIGMGTVFIVLIFISFIIALLPKLTAVFEGKGKKKEAAPAPKAAAPAPAPAVQEELADDLELVAVISAAIAAYTGTSSDDFVVRSIRRSTANKWKKA